MFHLFFPISIEKKKFPKTPLLQNMVQRAVQSETTLKLNFARDRQSPLANVRLKPTIKTTE